MSLALQETNTGLELCGHVEMLVLCWEITHEGGIMRADLGEVAPYP